MITSSKGLAWHKQIVTELSHSCDLSRELPAPIPYSEVCSSVIYTEDDRSGEYKTNSTLLQLIRELGKVQTDKGHSH